MHKVILEAPNVLMSKIIIDDKEVGRYIVPIVPDEARTFGMESLFRQCGIYSHAGQLYEPVDSDSLRVRNFVGPFGAQLSAFWSLQQAHRCFAGR